MKKSVLYLTLAGIVLAVLELIAFVTVRFVADRDMFDQRTAVLQQLDADGMKRFFNERGDLVLGWRNRGARTLSAPDCLGRSIEYSFDADGARLHRGFDAQTAAIIAVGDSFTAGFEAGDNGSWPAMASELLGVSVANHGVNGYGPTQSVLNFREQFSHYPRARFVVLGIMYENLFRMVNSYRPVLYDSASVYMLKPYMAGGRLVAYPLTAPVGDIGQFRQAADEAFDNDFWARPVAGFPYLLTLGQGVSSSHFYHRSAQKLMRAFAMPEYASIFKADDISLNLVGLLNRYADIAHQQGLKPVVVFIPNNRRDVTSAGRFVARHRDKLDPGLLVGDVAESSGVDWQRYNLHNKESGSICHPSPYGYRVIAEYIAALLGAQGVWPDEAL